MARKRAAKRSNPLQVRIVPVSLPAGLTRAKMLQTLKRAVKTRELPPDWEVNIEWRNPLTKKGRTRDWQEGEFVEVLEASRSGFATVVKGALDKAIAGAPQKLTPKKELQKRKPPKKTKAELHAIRSEASRKGWITRRKNEKAKAAATKKAAKKGGKRK